MGLFLQGINLVVLPPLALTSNLTPCFKSVDPIHLDKTIHNKRQNELFVSDLDSKVSHTTNTTFLLISPQFLALHSSIRDVLLRVSPPRQHGSDFYPETRNLASHTFLRSAGVLWPTNIVYIDIYLPLPLPCWKLMKYFDDAVLLFVLAP